MEEIAVSVLCATYNQEKYIRQALDGFVMQKTNFPFEVIVHDDASTDRTPEIIKEYANKYPNIIKPIYQKENQYSKGASITIDCIYPKARGKYFAFCEGDDFWIDENKLQKQYDIMEQNPDCHLCVHKVQIVSENGKKQNRILPKINFTKNIMDTECFFKLTLVYQDFHINSFLIIGDDYRNYINEFRNIRQLFRRAGIGDAPMIFYFGQLGKIHYINKIMSSYRKSAIGSWSLKNKNIPVDKKISDDNYLIRGMEEFDKYTLYKYHDLCVKRMFRYSLEIAKVTLNRKDLLFKNRKEFFGRFNLYQKIILLIVILLPNLTKKVYKMYKILRHKIG